MAWKWWAEIVEVVLMEARGINVGNSNPREETTQNVPLFSFSFVSPQFDSFRYSELKVDGE